MDRQKASADNPGDENPVLISCPGELLERANGRRYQLWGDKKLAKS